MAFAGSGMATRLTSGLARSPRLAKALPLGQATTRVPRPSSVKEARGTPAWLRKNCSPMIMCTLPLALAWATTCPMFPKISSTGFPVLASKAAASSVTSFL